MANKVKKLFIIGSVVSGLFMALTACNMSEAASQDISSAQNPSSLTSSEPSSVPVSSAAASSSSNASSSSSAEPDPIVLSSISATSDKTNYEWGEDLDITVTASYSDGTTSTITDYQVSGFDKQHSGEQDVVVSYQGKTCSLKVTVNDPLLLGISVTNNKTDYEWGEDELDLTVKANYSDGSSIEVTDYTVTGYNSQEPGEQTLEVSYKDKSSELTVKVNQPKLVSLTAVSNKENYDYGDQLDIIVKANYSDGSSVEITDYTVTGYNSENPGLQNVTIAYGGKECGLDVTVNEKSSFPKEKLTSFLGLEGIKTTVPSPIGYAEWSDAVELEQDGSKYFYATTNDRGTVDSDSIADQYAVSLENAGWRVEKNNGNYTATKAEGDVMLSFNTANGLFSFRVESYCEFPDKMLIGSLVSTKSNLHNDDVIVLGSISQEFLATNFVDGSLSTTHCVCTEDGPMGVAKNVIRFTLAQAGGDYWTLTDVYGRKLGATAVNKLAWDEGTTEWSILMSSSNAVIINKTKEFGRICFNPNSDTVTTYRSVTGTDLVYPQLFRLSETKLVYPTSISLEGKEQIGMGRSARMSIKYLPEDTNSLNDVVWSSSNETVATVKNGVVSALSIGQATITAKTKSKNSYLESSFVVEIKEFVGDTWTIMIYLCGSDLESGNGFASADIAEILKVNNQPDDVNVLIETGGSRYWRSYGIDANALSRYHVENRQLVLDQKLTKASMGKQSTLESFLNWGLQEYPADKTGVIFWNHGGALDGVCFDENFGSDSLTNSETSKAFKNVFEANNIDKLEFVGYDACLMQIQDVAEFNSHYFNYMVGSEEAEAGEGWVYDKWLDDVYADKDTAVILKENCDSFVSRYGSDQTLSYLNLSKMANYHAKFEALAAAIKTTAKNNSSGFNTLLRNCKYFTSRSYGEIDGMDFLNKLGANSTYSAFQTEINEAKSAYNALVSYSRKGGSAGNSNGLGIIVGSFASYPASETNFTNWRSLF